MRGPMIGAVTAGWCSSHASATSAGSLTELGAQGLPALELVAVRLDLALHVPVPRRPSLDLRDAPASSPPDSGLYGISPMPYSCTAGITSSSTVRAVRL